MRFEFKGYEHVAKGTKISRGGVVFVSDGAGTLFSELDATEAQVKTLTLGYGAEIVKGTAKKTATTKAKVKNTK